MWQKQQQQQLEKGAIWSRIYFLGAGKTHTMLGLDSEPGIYIRTLNDLFRAIEDSTEDLDCSVYMSYIEVCRDVL